MQIEDDDIPNDMIVPSVVPSTVDDFSPIEWGGLNPHYTGKK